MLVCQNLVGLSVTAPKDHNILGMWDCSICHHIVGLVVCPTLMQCPVLSKRLLVKVWIESDWPQYQVCSSLQELVLYGPPVSAWGIGWGGSHFSLWVDPPLKWV